ncbi:MAG: nicotinamide riboside transporter PnuC [Actinomycetes bacterium]
MSLLRWLFEAEVHFGSKSILWREIIGNAFGLAGAIYGMRRKVWTWPVGMAGNILLFTVFLGAVFHTPQDKNLYGQAGRQVFLIILSVYGWIIWHRNRGTNQGTSVVPRWTTAKEKISIFPVVVVFYAISYFALKALGSWAPLPDAWIFTGTVLATYGMSKGYVEFWLVWIAVDAVGVPLLIKGGYYPSAILYAIYGAFVIWGFVSWLSIASRERATSGKLSG